MHYSCTVSGGSQVGPSSSGHRFTSERLSRLLGLAWRGGKVNAILDKCVLLSELAVIGSDYLSLHKSLMLSEIGVPGSDYKSNTYPPSHAEGCQNRNGRIPIRENAACRRISGEGFSLSPRGRICLGGQIERHLVDDVHLFGTLKSLTSVL